MLSYLTVDDAPQNKLVKAIVLKSAIESLG